MATKKTLTFGDHMSRGVDLVRLGRLAEAGATVEVNFDASGEFVLGIIGKRGSGKSYSLGSILESLCTAEGETTIGRCSRNQGVLLFDTLDIFWSTAEPLKDQDREAFPREWQRMTSWGITPVDTDVVVYVPKGFSSPTTPSSYNELALTPGSLSVEDWADLLETDLFSDRMGQLLFDAYNKVAVDGWDGEDGHNLPDKNFQIRDLENCLSRDSEIQSLYARETIRALTQRLRVIGSLGFLGASPMELKSVIAPGRLSVVLLNRLPETLRSVLVSVLIRRILAERAEASDLEKHLKLSRVLSIREQEAMEQRISELIPPTIVAIDEAQNVLPSDRGTKATQNIIRFVREGRNHGLSFVFTTQQPSAIDARILAQVDTIIGHKLTTAADVRRFEDNSKSRNPDSVQLAGRNLEFSEWLRTLDQGQAIVSNTEQERNFVIDFRPRISPHGGQGAS